MDIKQVEQQHKEGLSQLAVLFVQKAEMDKKIKNLRNQLMQLEAVMQYSASSQQESTEAVAAPGGDEA